VFTLICGQLRHPWSHLNLICGELRWFAVWFAVICCDLRCFVVFCGDLRCLGRPFKWARRLSKGAWYLPSISSMPSANTSFVKFDIWPDIADKPLGNHRAIVTIISWYHSVNKQRLQQHNTTLFCHTPFVYFNSISCQLNSSAKNIYYCYSGARQEYLVGEWLSSLEWPSSSSSSFDPCRP